MTDSDSCPRCATLEQLLKRAEHDQAELGEQLAGVQIQARRAGQAEVAIRRQLQEAMEADPKSEQIRDVLNHWAAFHPRAKTPTGGKRFLTVKKALKLGFTVDQLKQALDGLRAFPYVGPAGRMGDGQASQRFDDVEHALRDEQSIERFIGYLENPPSAASRAEKKQGSVTPIGWNATQPSRIPAIDRLLPCFEDVKAVGLGKWMARCPAHEDRTASLSIALGDKGVVARCFAGCDATEIADAIRVPLSDWFDDEQAPRPRAVTVPQELPSKATIAGWATRLSTHAPMLARLRELLGWTPETLRSLSVGWDGQRLTLPVFGATGDLINIVRYLPNGTPKMLGLRNRERGLFPRPETRCGGEVWLVEGEPDAITGCSIGLPTVAVPGANGWRDEWIPRFHGLRVTVVPDCDTPGRRLAAHVASVLDNTRVIDLAPGRDDGYDLSDAVRDGWRTPLDERQAA